MERSAPRLFCVITTLKMVGTLSVLLGLAPLVWAQQALWNQCKSWLSIENKCLSVNSLSGGGNGWTGLTTCVSGACCQFSNDWYSQCLPCTTTSIKAASTSSSTSMKAISTSSSTSMNAVSTSSSAPSAVFTNPVLYEDFADNDIFLGPDNYFYYSASNMHYSPGAPILRSADLVVCIFQL